MKKTLAILLALALVFSSVTVAFAEETLPADAKACVDLGMIVGGGNGVTPDYLKETPTRIQAAVMYLRLTGREAAAKACTLTDNFVDAKDAAWAAPYMAYLKANPELGFNGIGGDKFDPNGKIDAKSYYKVMLTALGFKANTTEVIGDFTWNGVIDFAAKNGLTKVATVTNYTNNDLAIATMEALKANVKDGSKTLGVSLVDAKVLDAVKAQAAGIYTIAPVALTVDSVSATNLKEVVVKFNIAIDATKGADEANFAVKNNTVALATVAADKMSVTLTLGTAAAQQSDIDVTVKKGLGLAADVVKTISVVDTTLPTADSIVLTGPNTLEVTFSEPVKSVLNVSDVLVNNGVYGVASQVLSTSGKVLTVTLSATTLTEGDYAVKVKGYKDFADFDVMAKTFTVTYKKDVTAPTVTLKSATQTVVKVVFDKAVTQKGGAALDKTFFYQTYTAWKPVTVATTDNKTFTLTFNDADNTTIDPILPEGNITVTVLKSVSDVAVVDAWGNEMAADAKLVATIAADKTAPAVTSVEATAENEITVAFSEDVATLANTNFVIKNADGKVVTQTITDIDYDTDTFEAVLTLSAKLTGGSYTVEVKDVVDKALAANKIAAVTASITVTDKTPIDLTLVTAKVVTNAAAEEQYVYVSFPEKVATTGSFSALEKANYLVAGDRLKTADKVEMFGTDGKRVKITIAYRGTTPAAVVVAETTLVTVGRIADLAGNVPTLLSDTQLINGDTAPTTITAKAIALNKMVVTFEDELKTVIADGLRFGNNGEAFDNASTAAAIEKVEVKSHTNGSKYTEITAVVKSTDALVNKSQVELDKMVVYVDADKLVTITGQKVGDITLAAGNVDDGIRPVLAATGAIKETSTTAVVNNVNVTTMKVTVKFDENIVTASNYLAAQDLVITDKDGNTLVAYVDFEVAVANDSVVITLVGDYADYLGKLTISTKATVTYVTDANDNTITEFTGKTVTLDGTAD